MRNDKLTRYFIRYFKMESKSSCIFQINVSLNYFDENTISIDRC